MTFPLLSSRSLKTRVTLFSLLIFLISVWSLAFYTSHMLRADMQGQLGAQQFSTATILAAQINRELEHRFQSMQLVVKRVNPSRFEQAALQALLEEHVILQSMFSSGVYFLRADGTVLAEGEIHKGRVGRNYLDRGDIRLALTEGRSSVGKPHLSRRDGFPEFGMTVPVRDAQGQIIGALRGEISLKEANFLDQIAGVPYGKTGGYLIIARQQRLIITATDKRRVMETLPPVGSDPAIDRLIQGYEGSDVVVQPTGERVLASDKAVPAADWILSVVLPSAEAFAPIEALQQRLLLVTLVLTLLVGVLTRWMLRRQLAPLLTTANTLAALTDDKQFPSALPVTRQDEVGQLIGSFNHLLDILRQRDILLGQVLDNSSVAIFLVDMTGRITRANQRMAEMFGTALVQLIGSEYVNLIHPSEREIGRELMLKLFASAVPSTDVERLYQRPDGTQFWGHLTGRRFFDGKGNNLGIVAVLEDISERKLAHVRILESEERFRTLIEESPSAIVVHREGKLLYVNPAAVELLGARRAQELIGKEMLSFIHPDYHEMAQARMQILRDTGQPVPPREQKLVKLDGTVFDAEIQSRSIVYDGQSAIRTAFHDISERKVAFDKLQLAASVFTHAREGITITDANANIIDVNDAFSRITGFSRDEVLGQNPRLLSSGRQSSEFYANMWHDLLEEDHWYGEIWNRRKSGEVYPQMITISTVRDDADQVRHYVALFTDISSLKAHQHELEHIAHFDALTNLPNRVLLADRLQQGMMQAQRRGQMLALAYLDLDGFKLINDRHGHEAGDLLLTTLATRMKQALREGDTLARIGGDEFVAVLLDLSDKQDSLPMLRRLLAAAAEPVQLGELVLQVSASAGVTFYPQAEEIEADQLLRQADQAMYQAKQAGKHRYHFFDAEHDRSVRDQHESIERIRQALAADEFVLHYQPKVNMRTGQVVGAEALIRWQHPDKGLLAPAEFLPVIEDHPLAVQIGEWVIGTALDQTERWQDLGLDLPVSVNVGARQLQQTDFVERLRALLAAHPQVKPWHLEIEVLETSALEDMVGVAQLIDDCHQLGVLFAMDDFGTGYSSLTYLKRLRVTLLKIDQSFVCDMLDDPDDRAILEGIIGLASAFQRNVIAEGVETIAHGTLLLQLGCDLAQGFGIARPMPGAHLPAWAATWQRDAAWLAVCEA